MFNSNESPTGICFVVTGIAPTIMYPLRGKLWGVMEQVRNT